MAYRDKMLITTRGNASLETAVDKKTSQSGPLTRKMMAEEEGFEPSYGEYP